MQTQKEGGEQMTKDLSLVEGCLMVLHRDHCWPAIAHAGAGGDRPGPANFIYKTTCYRTKGRDSCLWRLYKGLEPGDAGPFTFTTPSEGALAVVKAQSRPPQYGTFFAVTGRCRDAYQLAAAYGTWGEPAARVVGAPREKPAEVVPDDF